MTNSVHININHQKGENRYIKHFAAFYISKYFPKITEVEIVCPDRDTSRSQPDYFLVQPRILVEVKEIHDREKLETITAWEYNIGRLYEELDSRDLSSLTGTYSVDTPRDLRVRNNEKGVIDQILSAIENGELTLNIPSLGNFEIRKISAEGHVVTFGFPSSFRMFDPARTIDENIGHKIGKANEQMRLFEQREVHKCILLLISKYVFIDVSDESPVEAIARHYNELLDYENIDEIWLQTEKGDGKFVHSLIYTRDFLISFDQQEIKTNKTSVELFGRWFDSLVGLGDECKEKLVAALKRLLQSGKPAQLFPNRFIREEMVNLGIWLAERDRFEDVVWLIDKFIDDPDPPEPENYIGDPQFNYHEKIAKGEDPLVITGVLGHLAWLVKELARSKEHIKKALNYTKRLLAHRNLYVKLRTLAPLIAIAARRQWLDGYGVRPYKGDYKTFHDMVFELVELIAGNPNYKALAEWLSHVFAYYKDLSTEEAERVLDALKTTGKSAGVFMYFGIFRQRHYKDQPIDFEPERLERKLKEIIGEPGGRYQEFRTNIIRYFRDILDENGDEFETLRPYIDLIIQQPYERGIYNALERIVADHMQDRPGICTEWYKTMLSRLSEFADLAQRSSAWEGVWLINTDKIATEMAQYNPGALLEVVELLVGLRKKGVFIGPVGRLSDACKSVSDSQLRRKIESRLRELSI